MKEIDAIEVLACELVIETPEKGVVPKNNINEYMSQAIKYSQRFTPDIIKTNPDDVKDYKDFVVELKDIEKVIDEACTSVMPEELLNLVKTMKSAGKDIQTNRLSIEKTIKDLRANLILEAKNNAFELIDVKNPYVIKRADFISQCHEKIKNIRINSKFKEVADAFAAECNEQAAAKLERFETIRVTIHDSYAIKNEFISDQEIKAKAEKYLEKGYDDEVVSSMVHNEIMDIKDKRRKHEEEQAAKAAAAAKAKKEAEEKAAAEQAKPQEVKVEVKEEPKACLEKDQGISKETQQDILKRALAGVSPVKIDKRKDFVFNISCDIHVLAENEQDARKQLISDWAKYFNISPEEFTTTLKEVK